MYHFSYMASVKAKTQKPSNNASSAAEADVHSPNTFHFLGKKTLPVHVIKSELKPP